MAFRSTKTYGHECGLSCTFRQWRATESHCSLLHGYALSFHFVFEAEHLDERNWVVDFGGLGVLNARLRKYFDHTLAVAQDDPQLGQLMYLGDIGIADVRVFPNVGCEAFAEFAYGLAESVLSGQLDRVRVVSCEVREHGANSAIYKPKKENTNE